MKRVKVMLSAILVMGIVAGALAFKVKSPGVCAYTRAISPNPPATTICNLTHATTLFVTTKTTAGLSTQYATIAPALIEEEIPCPTLTKECAQFKTLGVE